MEDNISQACKLTFIERLCVEASLPLQKIKKIKIPTISGQAGLIGMTRPLPAPWVSAVKCSGGPHQNWLVSKCHLSRTLRETPGGRNLETQYRTEEATNLEWWVFFPIWRGPREGLSVRNTCSYRHVRPALTSLLGCERI